MFRPGCAGLPADSPGRACPHSGKGRTAVAPGGTLLLVAHDSDNLLRGFGGPQHPDMLYTAEQVVAALGNELTIEKASQVSRFIDTKDGIQVAIDCLVRAKRI